MLHITSYFTGRIESDYGNHTIFNVTFSKTFLFQKGYGVDVFPIT